jgi:hypothetical protein
VDVARVGQGCAVKRLLFILAALSTLAACIHGVAHETDAKLLASEREDCDIVRRNPEADAGAHALGDRVLALGAARLIEAARHDVGTSDAGADGGDPCK